MLRNTTIHINYKNHKNPYDNDARLVVHHRWFQQLRKINSFCQNIMTSAQSAGLRRHFMTFKGLRDIRCAIHTKRLTSETVVTFIFFYSLCVFFSQAVLITFFRKNRLSKFLWLRYTNVLYWVSFIRFCLIKGNNAILSDVSDVNWKVGSPFNQSINDGTKYLSYTLKLHTKNCITFTLINWCTNDITTILSFILYLIVTV